MRAAVRVHSSEWQESGRRKAMGLETSPMALENQEGTSQGLRGTEAAGTSLQELFLAYRYKGRHGNTANNQSS